MNVEYFEKNTLLSKILCTFVVNHNIIQNAQIFHKHKYQSE